MAKKRKRKDEHDESVDELDQTDEYTEDDDEDDDADYDGSLRVRDDDGTLIDNGEDDDDLLGDDYDDAKEGGVLVAYPVRRPGPAVPKGNRTGSLLDGSREMWLSTIIAAETLLDETIDALSTVKDDDGEVVESLPVPTPTQLPTPSANTSGTTGSKC